MTSTTKLYPQIYFIFTATLLFIVSAVLPENHNAVVSPNTHTLMEAIMTLLALFISVMALLRYYFQSDEQYLIIGTGFLGASLLDGYHAIVTSPVIAALLPSEYAVIVPWSWLASRLYLSLFMLVCALVWLRKNEFPHRNLSIQPKPVFAIAGLVTTVTLIIFTLTPLPEYNFESNVPRAYEIIPGLFFALALITFLIKGSWQKDIFERWLVIFLIVSLFTQTGIMPFSETVNDLDFTFAHLLKKLSYICVLIGLLMSLVSTYRELRAETAQRKQLEKKLKQEAVLLKEETRKAVKAKQTQAEFLANMSHEIRTPMNGILGMLNLLRDTSLSTEQQHFTKQSQRSASTLLRIINDILDISKLESGKLEIQKNEIDLEKVVVDVGRLLIPEAESKGLELFCPAGPLEHCLVIGDSVRIRQILINLIGNAIKFTQEGYVKVAVEISENNDQKIASFSITDTGSGIAEEQIQKIFQRFRQADNSLTRQAGGTGLGLSISNELVTLMGGELNVMSTLGQGTTFSFTLAFKPVNDVNQSVVQPLKAEVVGCFAHPEYNHIVQSMLASWQMQGIMALSLSELAFMAESVKSSDVVVIIDSSLVNHDEFPTVERIKQAGAKVIFLNNTSVSTQGALRQKLADVSLIKPIAPSELYNALLLLVGDNIAERQQSKQKALGLTQLKQYNRTILIAEDDLINQQVAIGILSKFGLDVDLAENGDVALSKLEQGNYDLVFMDCMMPILDGYEATRRLRNGDVGAKNQHITVIALTANAIEGAMQECLDAGMTDYLSKPLDPAELVTKLDKWLVD